MGSENVKQVFKNVMEKVSNGEKINKTQAARDAGYSETSARSQKPFYTKQWQTLLDEIDEKPLLDKLRKIAKAEDKRAAISAIQELFKLKNRYPNPRADINIFRDSVKSLEE